MKRVSGRAIIFNNNKILLMHRIKDDCNYYTFFGGGKNIDETIEECVEREVLEEANIKVKCVKCVYKYISKNSEQYFYLCEYLDGIFKEGNGSEYNKENSKYGKYIPEKINVNDINDINLFPKIIKEKLVDNINKNGLLLSNVVECINDETSDY